MLDRCEQQDAMFLTEVCFFAWAPGLENALFECKSLCMRIGTEVKSENFRVESSVSSSLKQFVF